MAAFPWPIKDDGLILSNALAHVLAAHEMPADQPQNIARDAAALIIEACNQGVRDERMLANYTLWALKGTSNNDNFVGGSTTAVARWSFSLLT